MFLVLSPETHLKENSLFIRNVSFALKMVGLFKISLIMPCILLMIALPGKQCYLKNLREFITSRKYELNALPTLLRLVMISTFSIRTICDHRVNAC